MTDTTPRLALPFLLPGQAQKHVTVNESLARLDTLTQASARSASLVSEPATPGDSDCYILPAGRTGAAWGGMPAGALAFFHDGAWDHAAPQDGWRVWVEDAGQFIVRSGGHWYSAEGASANRLINAGFAVNQRKAASNADDTYCFDRWYVLTQSGAIAATALTDPEAGRATGIRLTQAHGTAQRFAIAQVVESLDCRDLRGRMVAMAARVRCSDSTVIRAAILEWTGPADAVVSDVVLDWSSADATAGGFFNPSPLQVVATLAVSAVAGTWTDLGAFSGSASGALNNAIVIIWTDAALATGTMLDLGGVQLEAGSACSVFRATDAATDLARCQRYFEVLPGIGGAPGVSPFAQRVAGNLIDCFHSFKVTKRAVPVLRASAPAFVSTNPAAANQVAFYNNAAAGFATATGAVSLSISGESPQATLLRLMAATAFSGTSGQIGNLYLGAGATIGFEAEL